MRLGPRESLANRRVAADKPGMRLLAVLLLSVVLAGCHRHPENAPRAALRVDVVGEMEGGPALSGPNEVLARATQATLVALDANGGVVPGLATSWRVSDDGLSIIFRLRDARWPDGRTVAAGDIVAVYRRLLGPGTRHPLAGLLSGIVGAPDVAAGRKPVQALGINDPLPNIVEIRLTAPQPELLQLLASPSMAIVRRGSAPPAGGAFRVEAPGGDDNSPIRLTRSATYFDAGAVPVGGIALAAVSDPPAAIARFQRGDTDVVIGGGLAGLAEAARLRGTLRLDPVWSSYGYLVNMARGPLADPRVRRALAMAVDRDALVAKLPDAARPATLTGLVPASLPSDTDPARPDWSDWTADARLAEARRLLAEAGIGTDKPLSIQVLIPQGDEHRTLLAAVADAWAQIGVQTVVLQKEQQDVDAAIRSGRFQLALAERMAPADTPLYFLDPFKCQGPAPCNRAAGALLAAARVTVDPVQRAQTIRRAEQMIVDDTPAIMLLSAPRWSLVATRVSGWTPNPLAAHPLSHLDVLPPG